MISAVAQCLEEINVSSATEAIANIWLVLAQDGMYQEPSWATQDFHDWAPTHTKKKKTEPQSGSENERQKRNTEVFRESARKAKAQLQLKLLMDIDKNKKSFYHYISLKPLNKENMGYLLNGDFDLETVGLGRAEVLHSFVTLSFSDMTPRP